MLEIGLKHTTVVTMEQNETVAREKKADGNTRGAYRLHSKWA